jgi:hypothetical protein
MNPSLAHFLTILAQATARSEETYRAELKRYLCFYLRLSRLSSPRVSRAILGHRTLAQSQLSALWALWTDSVWDDLPSSNPTDLGVDKGDENKGEDEYEAWGEDESEDEDEDEDEDEEDEEPEGSPEDCETVGGQGAQGRQNRARDGTTRRG